MRTRKKGSGPTRTIRTSVTGVTMGNRQEIIALLGEKDIRRLYLIREPDNKFDEFAIKVCARIPMEGNIYSCPGCGATYETDVDKCSICGTEVFKGKLAQIGYIKNRGIGCHVCGYVATVGPGMRIPQDCPFCNEPINREGLATRLAKKMDEGTEYMCEVLEYTGGGLDENEIPLSHGVNILIQEKA